MSSISISSNKSSSSSLPINVVNDFNRSISVQISISSNKYSSSSLPINAVNNSSKVMSLNLITPTNNGLHNTFVLNQQSHSMSPLIMTPSFNIINSTITPLSSIPEHIDYEHYDDNISCRSYGDIDNRFEQNVDFYPKNQTRFMVEHMDDGFSMNYFSKNTINGSYTHKCANCLPVCEDNYHNGWKIYNYSDVSKVKGGFLMRKE